MPSRKYSGSGPSSHAWGLPSQTAVGAPLSPLAPSSLDSLWVLVRLPCVYLWPTPHIEDRNSLTLLKWVIFGMEVP